MKLTYEQREFLKMFFFDNIDWIKEKDMLDPNDINKLIDLFSDYLEKSKYNDNESLNYFLVELKYSHLFESKVIKGEINLNIKEKIRRMSVTPSSNGVYKCKNLTIIKWYHESLIVKTISPNDRTILNKSLKPKLDQNAKERRLSFDEARKTWVK